MYIEIYIDTTESKNTPEILFKKSLKSLSCWHPEFNYYSGHSVLTNVES